MSHKEDEIDFAGGVHLNDSVFVQENYERLSSQLCNSRLPRREVAYFTQIVIKLLFIGFYLSLCSFILVVKSQHFIFQSFH